MSSLDHLPADQGAVLSLVLQRGRGYDEIAALLGIDRAAVRQRALDGFDTLGPSTTVPAAERALLTDYLLGQLPPRVAESVRDGIAESPAQRAWVRVIASEIGSLSLHPLPEIPAAAAAATVGDEAAAAPAEPDEAAPSRERAPRHERAPRREPAPRRERAPRPAGERPASSRRGGAVLLGIVAAVIVVVVVIVVATSGGGKSPLNPGTSTNAADTGTTGTTALKRLAAFNLTPPVSTSKALGIAQVAEERSTVGIVIIASGLPANTSHDAYGIWLYSSPTHQKFLGYYDDRVGKTGEMKVTSILPTGTNGYLSYSTLLITLESEGQKLTGPGTIELQGTVK
jgi:hypothetical protein